MNDRISTPSRFLRPLPEGLAFRDYRVLLATWFGAGLMKKAPGTFGTLAALPFAIALSALGGPLALLVAAIIVLYVGARVADFYNKKSGTHDNQSIVIDEVAGLMIAAIPAATVPLLWLAAFLLFRLFDIVKPWPASYFDKKGKGGWAVMLDDAVAGFYAMLGVAFLAFLITP